MARTAACSVEAEAKEEHLEPYLGLHYPASDIPRQARDLYRQNWLRIIPDARYIASPIVPALRSDTGAPIDLSFSVLRSVSPIHLEYMRNMGVRASMSISLVVGDRLWGLISCLNHTGPRFISYALRSACEAVGRLVSLQIAALDERERGAQRRARQDTQQTLARAMHEAPPGEDVLTGLPAEPEALLHLVGASGAAVVGAGAPQTCGDVPPTPLIMDIARWLDEEERFSTFVSSSLASAFTPASACKDVASGLLVVGLPGAPRRRVIWFRPLCGCSSRVAFGVRIEVGKACGRPCAFRDGDFEVSDGHCHAHCRGTPLTR